MPQWCHCWCHCPDTGQAASSWLAPWAHDGQLITASSTLSALKWDPVESTLHFISFYTEHVFSESPHCWCFNSFIDRKPTSSGHHKALFLPWYFCPYFHPLVVYLQPFIHSSVTNTFSTHCCRVRAHVHIVTLSVFQLSFGHLITDAFYDRTSVTFEKSSPLARERVSPSHTDS